MTYSAQEPTGGGGDCRPVLASTETGVRAPDGYRETITDYYCEVHHREFYQIAGSHP